MINIIRWMFGYVMFSATGKFPERLINLISRRGLILWNVKKSDQAFMACIRASDYKMLRPYAKKAGLLLRVQKRYGAPFLLRKLKPRMGVLVGILCFFIIIHVMSMFVWKIDVEGIETLNRLDLINATEELGFKEGSLANGTDIQIIEQGLMEKFSEVAWISINIKGSCATISVKERIVPPDIIPDDQPCDIRSTMDAQVFRMEVYEGSAMVNNGDAVVKGQLLVSGIVEDIFGGSTLHHACAKIYANTKREIEETVPFEEEVNILTDKVIERKSMKLFCVNIPLSLVPTPVGDWDKQFIKSDVNIGDAQLPICVYKQIFRKQTKEKRILNKEEAKLKAKEKIAMRECQEFSNIKILERNEVESIDDKLYKLKVEYYCEEDIAIQQEILME